MGLCCCVNLNDIHLNSTQTPHEIVILLYAVYVEISLTVAAALCVVIMAARPEQELRWAQI